MFVVAIVDDDQSVRLATESLVKSLGYTPILFASAEDFLQSAHASTADCVITDIKMPGMTGADLQDALLARGSAMPMIFMTAFPETRVRERVLAAGAIGFLDKPFSGTDIIQCLAKALGPHPP